MTGRPAADRFWKLEEMAMQATEAEGGVPHAKRRTEVHARIRAVLESYVASGKAPGYAVAILERGEVLFDAAIGVRDRETGTAMMRDTRFAMASMSKPFTAVAIMQLREQGLLQLDDPVARFLPELASMRLLSGAGTDPADTGAAITIGQLLSHTSGLSYGAIKVPGSGNVVSDMYYDAGVLHHRVIRPHDGCSATLEEMITRLSAMPLAYRPGTSWEYSIASDVLARVVEVLSGKRFDRYLAQNLFEPLRMTSTGFAHANRSELAVMYDRDADGGLVRNDVMERYVEAPSFVGGGGELLCTAPDYMRFGQMLLSRGELNGVRILTPESVELMTANQINPEQRAALVAQIGEAMAGFGFGYGFAVLVDPPVDSPFSPGTYFWNGGGGTMNWIDPAAETVAVVMKHVRFETDFDIVADIKSAIAP
jgi:CubicO group peptidase (beta-lactamase class C family)